MEQGNFYKVRRPVNERLRYSALATTICHRRVGWRHLRLTTKENSSVVDSLNLQRDFGTSPRQSPHLAAYPAAL